MIRSWRSGTYQETAEARTWAEGLATRRPAKLTLDLMRDVMDDAVLVTDDELRHACRLIIEHTHNLAEGAGAATVAAAFKERTASPEKPSWHPLRRQPRREPSAANSCGCLRRDDSLGADSCGGKIASPRAAVYPRLPRRRSSSSACRGDT